MAIEYAGLKIPVDRASWLEMTRAAARRHGLDEVLFVRQVYRESAGFDPDVISGKRKSPKGATGIAQFMPTTALEQGLKDPTDPHASLDVMGRLMSRYFKKYGGNIPQALAAYNAGTGAVAKYGGVPPYPETIKYIESIQRPTPGARVRPDTVAGSSVRARQATRLVTQRETPEAAPTAGGFVARQPLAGPAASRTGAEATPTPPPVEGSAERPVVETVEGTALPPLAAPPVPRLDAERHRMIGDLLYSAGTKAIQMGRDEPPEPLVYSRAASIMSGISAALDPEGYRATAAEYEARHMAPVTEFERRQAALQQQIGTQTSIAGSLMAAEEQERARAQEIASVGVIIQSLPELLQGAGQIVQNLSERGENDPEVQLVAEEIAREMSYLNAQAQGVVQGDPANISALTRDTFHRSISSLQRAIEKGGATIAATERTRAIIEGANFRALLSLMGKAQGSRRLDSRTKTEISQGMDILGLTDSILEVYTDPTTGKTFGSEAPGGPIGGLAGTALPIIGRHERKVANKYLEDLFTTIAHMKSGAAWSAQELAHLLETVPALTDRPKDIVFFAKDIKKRVLSKINLWSKMSGMSNDEIEEILTYGLPEEGGLNPSSDAIEDLPDDLRDQLNGYAFVGATGYE